MFITHSSSFFPFLPFASPFLSLPPSLDRTLLFPFINKKKKRKEKTVPVPGEYCHVWIIPFRFPCSAIRIRMLYLSSRVRQLYLPMMSYYWKWFVTRDARIPWHFLDQYNYVRLKKNQCDNFYMKYNTFILSIAFPLTHALILTLTLTLCFTHSLFYSHSLTHSPSLSWSYFVCKLVWKVWYSACSLFSPLRNPLYQPQSVKPSHRRPLQS